MWLSIITVILLLGYVSLVLWYWWAWTHMPTDEVPPDFEASTRISVIIPARNESLNIDACLQGIVAQQYPLELVQVIVLDDGSEDDTASRVEAFTQGYPFIQCVSVDQSVVQQAHKKRAIELGISLATGDLIVCTDADCVHKTKWLSSLAYRYEQGNVQFIAAPVVYQTGHTILSVFQTLDFMALQGITAASVSQKFHTMCNGANIAYDKAAFYKVGGFAGIDKQPTGDDMLLMYKIYKQYPKGVVYLRNTDAVVTTGAAPDWKSFFNQRIRWASKAAYYDDKRIFRVLLLVYFVNVWMVGLVFLSFIYPLAIQLLFLMLLCKTMVEYCFMFPVAQFFNKMEWMMFFPFFQPMHIVYTVIAGWLGRFGSYKWKGRTIVSQK